MIRDAIRTLASAHLNARLLQRVEVLEQNSVVLAKGRDYFRDLVVEVADVAGGRPTSDLPKHVLHLVQRAEDALWSIVALTIATATDDQLAQYGGPGYDNVIVNFLPLLRARGITEAQIHRMTVENPARAFAYDAGGARRRYLAETPTAG